MAAHNVGALVVLRSGDMNQLAGIVTERGRLAKASSRYKDSFLYQIKCSDWIYSAADFARKILLPGRPSQQTRVEDIMTEEVNRRRR
jgi:hypothetical protein